MINLSFYDMATLYLFYGPKNLDRAQEQYGYRLGGNHDRNFNNILTSYEGMVEALGHEALDRATINSAIGKVPPGNGHGFFDRFHFDPLDERQIKEVISALRGSK